jgi:hypothetical protein
MLPLTALVETIRSETGRRENVPHFDPADGGSKARCLSLLEAPSRNAVGSGFVSRNNPDDTAKAKDVISEHLQSIKLVAMPHPSPLFVNRKPTNRAQLLGRLHEIAQLLNLK